MGKKEINKPEITVETFNRAIRTYQREDVSYEIPQTFSI